MKTANAVHQHNQAAEYNHDDKDHIEGFARWCVGFKYDLIGFFFPGYNLCWILGHTLHPLRIHYNQSGIQ